MNMLPYFFDLKNLLGITMVMVYDEWTMRRHTDMSPHIRSAARQGCVDFLMESKDASPRTEEHKIAHLKNCVERRLIQVYSGKHFSLYFLTHIVPDSEEV